MTTAKHAPGPWSTGGKYATKTVLLNAKGESIASGGNNRSVQGEELEASLQLAAAAPDLLEACWLAVEKLESMGLAGSVECKRIRVAIAKTTAA